MSRRAFLQSMALGAAGLAIDLPGAARAGAAPSRRPNVLFVFSDQQRAASMPGEPFSPVQAPNIARFRAENMSLDNCISNYPLCTPYRGILMSGRWPEQTGLVGNNIALDPDEVTLGRWFAAHGYNTGYVGKWHLQGPGIEFVPPGPRRLGFEDWHVWVNTNAHYGAWTYDPDTGEKITATGWSAAHMTDQAIGFLQSQTTAQPWLLVVSWNPPHPPFNPPAEDAALYPPGTLPLPPNVSLSLSGDKAGGEAHALTSEAALREAMQGYYGSITRIDVEFGRLLQALEASGLADDTLVVYTSDHGEMMGAQGRMAKRVPFDESCRVPFIARLPGTTPRGARSQAVFSAVDIYPTLCGLVDLPVPQRCVGRDFSPLLRGEPFASDADAAFLMNYVAPDSSAAAGDTEDDAPAAGADPVLEFTEMPNYRGIRTATHTYAVAQTGRWCLFEHASDPWQMNNLVADPAQATLMAQLDARILGWLASTGDAFPYAKAIRRVSGFPA